MHNKRLKLNIMNNTTRGVLIFITIISILKLLINLFHPTFINIFVLYILIIRNLY